MENKELECREDPVLKDLKEDVVQLSHMLHKLEMPKAKFPPLEELQVSVAIKQCPETLFFPDEIFCIVQGENNS